METIVQWATILSPIIAVLIAFWVSRASKKDTAKQIKALRDLCVLQNSMALDMLEMEYYKYYLGKEEDKSELNTLWNELQQIRQEERPNFREITRLQCEIDKLRKNVQYKDNFTFKIMMRQFELIQGNANIKKMK